MNLCIFVSLWQRIEPAAYDLF